jgi:transcriptional regulator with XRE-family HTH domain
MDEPLARTIAEALRKARKARGFTQAELAEHIGLATESYGRLERGEVVPGSDTLVRLAQTLQVSTDALVGLGTPESTQRLREAPAPYEPDDPPEIQRLVRRLRRLPTRTLQSVAQLVTSVLEDLDDRRR